MRLSVKSAPTNRRIARLSGLLLLTASLGACGVGDRLANVGIDSYVRGWEKPSDHVPVWADLDLDAA